MIIIVIMIIIFSWCMLHSRYMCGIAGNFILIIKSQQAALLLLLLLLLLSKNNIINLV